MTETSPSASLPEPGLLIAVTGGPGSSKTSLLAQLAAVQIARGHKVDGVLALAGERRQPHQGAQEYRLQLLGERQELRWAVRNEQLSPPYDLEPDTEQRLRVWADGLRRQPPVSLLLLDEFGRFEAQGRGLMPLWPALAAAAPQIVVMAVRVEVAADIEQTIGRRFDLRIAATAPDALEQLRRACEDFGEWTRIGLFGGAAGGLELTVGSALHATRIPLTGLVMSSLQGAMMVFAGSGLSQPGRVVWVPFISGGLKALSPAGNRLRPMLAIVLQGVWFGASVQVFGWNLLSLALGGALIGAWAALQGFFLQYLMLGGDLLQAYDTLVAWVAREWHLTAPGLPWLIGGWAVLHALIAAGATMTAWWLKQPPAALQRIIDREKTSAPAPAPAHAGWRRLREFGRWQFWLPLLIVAAILLGSGRPWAAVAWLALRFVAVGGVLLALVSLLRPASCAEQMRRRGWWGPALAFSGALRRRGPVR